MVGARLLLRRLPHGNNLRRPSEHLLIHVAERDDFNWRNLDQTEQIALAVPAAADEADALLLVCEFCGIVAEGRQRQSCRTDLNEFPAVHGYCSSSTSLQAQAAIAISAQDKTTQGADWPRTGSVATDHFPGAAILCGQGPGKTGGFCASDLQTGLINRLESGLGVALGYACWSLVGALGWLWTPESVPSLCLDKGLVVASVALDPMTLSQEEELRLIMSIAVPGAYGLAAR